MGTTATMAEIEALLPRLAAELAVEMHEPVSMFAQHPQRVLSWLSRRVTTGPGRVGFEAAVLAAYEGLK